MLAPIDSRRKAPSNNMLLGTILLDAVFHEEFDGANDCYVFGFPTKLFTGNRTPYLNIS